MADLFFAWIYIGGLCGCYGRSVGFWQRVFWPMRLSERLGDLVFPTRDI